MSTKIRSRARRARFIDSRGNPTVEADVILDGGAGARGGSFRRIDRRA